MIQKIKSNEYLKRYESMNAEERRALCDRVGQWIRSGGRRLMQLTESDAARLQNVIQVSVGWNDADSQSFSDGVRLMTAFAGKADTWLPDMLYAKSAARAIRQVVKVLDYQLGDNGNLRIESGAHTEHVTSHAHDGSFVITEKQAKRIVDKYTEKVLKQKHDVSTAREPQRTPAAGAGSVVPVRPKHIDQYVHLLPESTQKKAATVQGLLRELDQARENMALTMNDPHASGNDRAKWAMAATKLDDKVKAIYKELDSEWAKVVADGRVAVDDLGNAHIVASEQNGESQGEESPHDSAQLTSEQKHRRRELRKWLVDTRRGAEGKAREKRIEQWKVNIREYLTLEGEAAFNDERIIEAAKHFDINIEELKETKN